ncbi:MAG TPA: YceI family protein [Caulobacteraceae bacterium]|jgi:polyisoprenoid-binding protein YceI|nr:YceI family protein [Caulobacteraceae bacterium]
MKYVLAALAAIALAASAEAASAPPAPALPAGVYTLDKAHGSLTFRVNHMGFSNYTARFGRFDARLTLDPAHPAAASVTATVDPKSLELNAPPPGFEDELRGPHWLDAGKFPQMTFRSTRVVMTGKDTARIVGDFTLHGVTRPVTLEARFNGGYPGMAMDPHARVGFSAHGTLNRSEFGIAFGVPAPGSKMGVSDAVEVLIEAEFTGPAWKPPAR